MRIMIDTNVLISVFLFSNATMNELIDEITSNHTIVLSSYVIEELKAVIKLKFPKKYESIDKFLSELPFEYTYTPEIIDATKYPAIRDKKDLPVLVSAITAEVDILITGDKDFECIEIEKPEILTLAEFLNKYKRKD